LNVRWDPAKPDLLFKPVDPAFTRAAFTAGQFGGKGFIHSEPVLSHNNLSESRQLSQINLGMIEAGMTINVKYDPAHTE
jgi:hypothetical protein